MSGAPADVADENAVSELFDQATGRSAVSTSSSTLQA
jgi:hypothetical protein